MSEEPVIWEKDPDDAFVTLTMNRPDKMNAMNQAMGDALEAAVLRAAKAPDVRAIVLTGAGRAFSAGFDLGGEDFEMDADRWREDIGENMRRFRLIREARDARGEDAAWIGEIENALLTAEAQAQRR